jgi:hypothetical protein
MATVFYLSFYARKGSFMKPHARNILCLLGLLLWLPSAAIASGHAPAPVTTEVATAESDNADLRDPAALAELKRATDFLVTLPNFHIRAAVAYDVIQEDGRRLQFEKHGDIYLQRPDRLFAEVRLDDGRHRQFWYDGKTLSFAERSRNLHTQVNAPPTIDATLDMLEKLMKDPMPMADLLYSDLNPLADRAFEADVVGDSLVNGRNCQHLAFRGETVDWQIWVEQGATPFIRKLVISYREQPGTPQHVAALDLWEIPERFNDSLFTFAVPPGSEWIDLLMLTRRQSETGGQP